MLNISKIARLFSFQGRTTRSTFRAVMIALLATTLILWMTPLVRVITLVWPLLLWLYAATCARRLHDVDKSAWLIAVPLAGVGIVWAGVLAIVVVGMVAAVLGAGQSGMAIFDWTMRNAPLLSLLPLVVFAAWLGLRPGSQHTNRHGLANA